MDGSRKVAGGMENPLAGKVVEPPEAIPEVAFRSHHCGQDCGGGTMQKLLLAPTYNSKEKLLSAYEDVLERTFSAVLACTPSEIPPFTAMTTALYEMVDSFGTEEAKTLDRLMRSTEALRARK